jgi:anti-sigma factor RsiW
MSGQTDEPQEDPRWLAELSALADGTLDPARRREVEARVAASPDLRERLERERRAVAVLATARERDRAPGHLRARIEAASGPVRQSRPPMRIALAGAVAAVALVLALLLPSGTPGGPSVSQAAALGARGATMAAPAAEPSNPGRLRSAVGALHFPNWGSTLGWQATGQRQDRLDGRRITTVYYATASHTVAYSIVSGPLLRRPQGHYDIQSFRLGDRTVVTWREAGHTCVLSAAGLSERVLAGLVAHA